jgi:hypothetical protein
MEFRPRLFPFKDCQLLSQSGILQCDLFVASKDENDKSQYAENRFEHDATLCLQRCPNLFDASSVLAKDKGGFTQGNLSGHLTKLEEAGYVAIEKSFKGKVPLTVCRLTTAGKNALREYSKRMQAILKS